MAPKRRSSKKTAKKSSSKRRCTTSTTSPPPIAASIKKEEDEVSAVTTNTNVDNNEVPTPSQLSEELCTIVSKRYSRDEASCALDRLIQWADTGDPEFLKLFHRYAGDIKVLDFLTATLIDSNCVGTIRMRCIQKAANVLMLVCSQKHDGSNKEIVTKIATSVMNYNGIDTLINASEEYFGGDDLPQVQALERVWAALASLACHTGAMETAINKDKANILFDTGIDILVQLKSKDIATSVLGNVFVTLRNIVCCQYMEMKQFQETTILSKCLDVFRNKDGMWGGRSEPVTDKAIRFIVSCYETDLLDWDDDYEMLLPFLAMCLNKFGSVDRILESAIFMIHDACYTIDEKKIIERSGIMEPLGALLASNDINEAQKKRVHDVIVTIVTTR